VTLEFSNNNLNKQRNRHDLIWLHNHFNQSKGGNNGTSKQVRQRLGSMITDLKYVKDEIKLVTKPGDDDYVAVIANAEFSPQNGLDIPKESDEKPEKVEDKPNQKFYPGKGENKNRL